jgi:hypothetical protein
MWPTIATSAIPLNGVPEIHALAIDDFIALDIATREMPFDPIVPAKADGDPRETR